VVDDRCLGSLGVVVWVFVVVEEGGLG
jgi:hypothetical protein